MISPSSTRTRPSISRRLLGGFGLLAFLGAFFVLPLYAALSICMMPCCGHGENGGATLASANMMSCATECSIRSDEATASAVPSVAPRTSPAVGVPAVMVIAAAPARPPIAVYDDDVSVPARGSVTSLLILNSTFRI